MTTEALLHALQTARIVLTLTPEGALHCRAPKGAMTSALQAELRKQKPTIVALLRSESLAVAVPTTSYETSQVPVRPLTEIAGVTSYPSDILGRDILVAKTDQLVHDLWEQSYPAYSLRELHLLRDMRDRDPEGFPDKFRTLHTLKVVLGTTIITLEQAPVAREEGA